MSNLNFVKKFNNILSNKLILFCFLSVFITIFFWSLINKIEAKTPPTVSTTTLMAISPVSETSDLVEKPLKNTNNPVLFNQTQAQNLSSQKPNNLQFLPEDIRQIVERGKLVVAVRNEDTPPFIMIKEGCQNLQNNEVCANVGGKEKTFYGLDIEIAQGIVASINGGLKKVLKENNTIKLELNPSQQQFDKIVGEVVTTKADIAISKLSISPERAVMVRFSKPYLTMDLGLLVNRKRLESAYQRSNLDKITLLKQLPKKKIGVLEGSFSGRLAEKLFTDSDIQPFPPTSNGAWKDIIEAVKKDDENEPIAAFRDELEIKLEVFRNPNTAIYLETVLFTDIKDLIAIAISADKPQLINIINQYLTRERHDYTVDNLICRYPEAFYLKQDDKYLEKNCK